METFHWITATVGMVMALGMTRLLSSGVTLFRSRGRAQIDWVPVVWSALIFYSMLDFSWDFRQPSGVVSEWTFVRCLALLGVALTLFVSASLILPQNELSAGENLRTVFERDGRWALAFISAYDFLCVVFNWWYWHESPISIEGAVNVILGSLALTALKVTSRKIECATTLLYAFIIIGTAFFIG